MKHMARIHGEVDFVMCEVHMNGIARVMLLAIQHVNCLSINLS